LDQESLERFGSTLHSHTEAGEANSVALTRIDDVGGQFYGSRGRQCGRLAPARSGDHPPIRIPFVNGSSRIWLQASRAMARRSGSASFGGIAEAERGTSSFRVGHRAWNVGLRGWC
jgi:hypothetical protein